MKPVLLSFVPEPAGAEIFYCAILFRNRSPGGKKRVHAVGTWFRNTPQPFSYIPVRSRAILDRKWRDQTEERKKTFGPIGFLRRRTYSNRAQPQSCFAHWLDSEGGVVTATLRRSRPAPRCPPAVLAIPLPGTPRRWYHGNNGPTDISSSFVTSVDSIRRVHMSSAKSI